MKKHLIYKSDGLEKHWQIELEGAVAVITESKKGGASKVTRQDFKFPIRAITHISQLIEEKLIEGYEDPESPVPAEWRAIAKSPDLQKSLVQHFDFLCYNGESRQKLQKIIAQVVSVKALPRKLLLQFKNGSKLEAGPPQKKIAKFYPESFKNILLQHSSLLFQNRKGTSVLISDNTGSIQTEWLKECESSVLDIIKNASKIVAFRLNESGDYYVFHPVQKNSSGQPKIYLLPHDSWEFEELGKEGEKNIGTWFMDQCLNLLKAG